MGLGVWGTGWAGVCGGLNGSVAVFGESGWVTGWVGGNYLVSEGELTQF